jgi:hypothetical protein
MNFARPTSGLRPCSVYFNDSATHKSNNPGVNQGICMDFSTNGKVNALRVQNKAVECLVRIHHPALCRRAERNYKLYGRLTDAVTNLAFQKSGQLSTTSPNHLRLTESN